MYFKLIQVLSIILKFVISNDFAEKGLLVAVPVIPVVRLTFQEQPSAFVFTLPDMSKAHSHPPLSPAPEKGLQWQWERTHFVTQIVSPDRLWGHPLLSKWESNSLERVAMHCSWNWFMLHTWRSFLSSYLGNHPRGILTESLKEVGWNLWQQFVYGFRLTVFSLSLPQWCFIFAIR